MTQCNIIRQAPYGCAKFEQIVGQKYAYVDKTKFIEVLEKESGTLYPFIVRPRRFGKTLFTSVLQAYYDRSLAGRFEQNFKGTYIFDHKTELASTFRVLKFDFSGNSKEEVIANFIKKMHVGISSFVSRYPVDGCQKLLVEKYTSPSAFLDDFVSLYNTQIDQDIFIIIDEYDQFSNEVLAEDKDLFRQVTSSHGFLKDFYASLKSATVNGPVARVFITGVTSISLDSMTSGFNIAKNISPLPKFAAMLGFTDEELKALIPQVVDLNKYDHSVQEIYDRMKDLYDGYRFSRDSNVSVFNSSMSLYYLDSLATLNREPDTLLDPSFSTDLSKVDSILSLGSKDVTRKIIEKALRREPIVFDQALSVVNLNSKNKLSEADILSTMVYMGYLTYTAEDPYALQVPNRAVSQQFFEYYFHYLKGSDDWSFVPRRFEQAFFKLAQGDPSSLLYLLTSALSSSSGIHKSLHLSESDYQTMLQAAMFFNTEYQVKAEQEVCGPQHGFTDLVFIPKNTQFCSYVFELKYLTRKAATNVAVNKALEEAKQQLHRYSQDEDIGSLQNLKLVAVVFAGTEIKALWTGEA